MKYILTIFLCVYIANLNAQILINEVAPTNLTTISDEDLEYPDWLEIFNAGAAAVNLKQYALTDKTDFWNQWLFPDTVLLPGERLLVFASGKNRNGYNAEIESIDHWETAVFETDIWDYFEGEYEPPVNWKTTLFVDPWNSGPGGFGFGDDDDNTLISEDVSSIYYRIEFEVIDKTKLIQAIINMDYDDGYVIYLNGFNVASAGLSDTPSFDELSTSSNEAQMYDGGSPLYIHIDSATLSSFIVNGINVIAVEVHNKTAGSNDLSGITYLSFGITDNSVFYSIPPGWFTPITSTRLHTNFKVGIGETVLMHDNSGLLLDSITVNNVAAAHVKARISDGGTWCISDNPTPELANVGICYSEYSAIPFITPAAGFYTTDQTISMLGINVKYTLDGTEPDFSSENYLAPFNLSATTIVKAKCFEDGKLPGPMVTQSIFINEQTLLPVVSLSATPCDLFDLGDSCLAAYDDVSDFNNNNPQAKVTIEYFEADKTFGFGAETKFEAVGNYSIGLPQKGVQFTCDEDFNSPENIPYPLFQKDKPSNNLYHAFRLRNTDNDSESTRMRDLIVNRFALPTYNIAAGSTNVAAYINGEYWGHYVSRERLDAYFCRDNFGCDPESVDMIKTSFTVGSIGDYTPEVGTDTAFFNLRNYCVENDLSIDENFLFVTDKVDEQNFADYYATEIYIANDDWIGGIFNNVRLFRATSPEVEWKFILWDLSYSQDGEWGTGPGSNSIDASLDDNNYYNDIFMGMLDNPVYHNYFINRFADLMNYYYTPEIIHSIIDINTAEMITEMNAQNDRWGTGDSLNVIEEVENLKNFHNERRNYMFDDIENYFDLNAQVNINIDVNPPGAGYIKISTIIPQTLPWTGVYFDGALVTLTAIPNPGYAFVDWDTNIFIDTITNISFTNNINASTTFIANFYGSLITNPIVISEVNYNCDSTFDTGDWIELNNTSLTEINISDYTFSNNIFYNDYKFATNSIISPDGYLVLAEDIDKFLSIHPDITNVVGGFNFDLSNDGDSITLIDFSNNTVSAFSYLDSKPWPVTADSYGRTMELKTNIANPSLGDSWFAGCIGGSPGAVYSACLQNPLIDEINYNSLVTEDAGDWFELFNNSGSDFDLSGWKIKDKQGYVFNIPAGTVIGANNYLAFYQDNIKFTSQFPTITNKTGPLNFGFDGNGDVILIYQPDGKLYQSVGFDDISPYPLSPDGGGYTLQIVDASLNLNDPINWTTACPEGSPGEEFTMPCATSTEEISGSATITVYPNPATDIISIILPVEINPEGTLFIYNIEGKQILLQLISSPECTININSFTPGMYLLKLLIDEDIFVSAFMKE